MPHQSPWVPEKYLPLLRAVARRQLRLDKQLQPRFDDSDVVGQAMIDIVKGLGTFAGTTEAEFIKWLLKILQTTFLDMVRQHRAGARTPDLEANAKAVYDKSSIRIDRIVAGREASPSVAAMRRDVMARFADAVERLPPEWRDAVLMRDIAGLTINEIAAAMSLTEKSVAGHLRRGRKRLREAFPDYGEACDD